MRTYTIILEPSDDGGFVVTVPALPEVGTQGENREDALFNAKEAIELAVEHRLSRGEIIPPDRLPEIGHITIAA